MPLVDALNVAKDHPVAALPQLLGHRDLRLLLLLALPHEGDVGVDLCQVLDIHLLRLQELLQPDSNNELTIKVKSRSLLPVRSLLDSFGHRVASAAVITGGGFFQITV